MKPLLSKLWFKCLLVAVLLIAFLFGLATVWAAAYLAYQNVYVDPNAGAAMARELFDDMENGYLHLTLGNFLIWWIQHPVLLAAVAVLCVLAVLVSFILLLCAAGHKEGVEGIYLCWFHRIPLDLLAGLAVLAIACLFWITEDINWWPFFVLGLPVIVLPFVLSFAARAKAPGLLKNTVIYMVLHWIVQGLQNLPLVWKTVLIWGAAGFVDLIFWAATRYDADGFLFWFFPSRAVLVLVTLHVAGAMKQLQKLGAAIAEGRADASVKPIPRWLPHLRRHADNLSSIQLGMHRAVEAQMRSERMKTELITNVSHDIKTPLTSIVNYVDLLKKEDIQPDKAREYVDVLDRQSARLRKLTEDLVEASKASAGAVPVHPTLVDVNVLISQIAGEYVDRLDAAQLETVFKPDPARPQIMADERLLGRVIDNLVNNICKYAQPGTRVYFESAVRDGQAVLSFKNISRYELDIPADELMARFVRGDRSRHSEGSGLGLSIAQSLTQLQGGQFRLEIDGDLFKAIVSFPCYTAASG